jgi:2-dehydro-3-deoxyglucarate aldolase/4-hydroxy-2-oxoheptanedioate aldolase
MTGPSESFGDLTRRRELKLGSLVLEFVTPAIGPVMKSAGCDFVMVDMEHTGFSFETVKTALRYVHDAGMPSLVRPPSKRDDHIARACDMGAQGLSPPMLESAAEARHILELMKYVPDGRRGACLRIAHDDYSPGPVRAKFEEANTKTSLVALIETTAGVENADEIAAVDGVDCLWIGPLDLSCSLGVPGEFDHPDFIDATARVVAAAQTHRKSLGRGAATIDEGVELYEAGFDFILYSADVWLLENALTAGLEALRAKCTRATDRAGAKGEGRPNG